MTTIEKVAKAITAADWTDAAHPFTLSPKELEERVEEGWRSNVRTARAALEALRDPPEGCTELGAACWIAMIEGELEDTTNSA